jgi:hypothetical protein
MTRTVFESLAWLFAPAEDPAACALIEADDDWRLRLPATHGSVVWGRMPARHQGLGRALRAAVARERGLRASREGSGALRYWDLHRIPPIGRRPRLQAAMRGALMSGAVVRLGSGPRQPRVADRIAEQAGHRGPDVHLRVSGDGSVLARLTLPAGPPALLRLATIGGLKDAARNSDALSRLGDAAITLVPRNIGAGTMLGAGWSAEGELPGTPVRTLTRELLEEVVAWSSSLPPSGTPAVAAEERLELIMRSFPRSAVDLRPALDRVRQRARDVPGVLQHGDLWAGNLLAGDGHLTGVVDWDNWHAAGVPGSDLLHLVAMARRSQTRLELGELWLERPWAARDFQDATATYWSQLGLQLTDDLAWLVGVDWWAAHVTAGLRRGRRPASDPRWVARNVDNVAPLLAAIR